MTWSSLFLRVYGVIQRKDIPTRTRNITIVVQQKDTKHPLYGQLTRTHNAPVEIWLIKITVQLAQ